MKLTIVPIIGPIKKKIIKQFLPSNPIIVEAGAHKGRDTIHMVKLWPQAKLYAFEPVPALFHILSQSVKELSGVTCYQLALSDSVGRAPLYVSSGRSDAASSLLRPKKYLLDNPQVTFNESIMVDAITLDVWAQDEGIQAVDFLWLDLQGHEMAMLQASPNILKTVKAIHTEVNCEHRFENNPLYSEFVHWLQDQNFVLYQEHLHKKSWGNALFINKKCLSDFEISTIEP